MERTAFTPIVLAAGEALYYVVRTRPGERAAVQRDLEQVLLEVDPRRVLRNVQSFGEIGATAYQNDRAMTVTLLTVIVLLVAVTVPGIFGLMSFNLNRRRKKIGTRRSLGARRELLALDAEVGNAAASDTVGAIARVLADDGRYHQSGAAPSLGRSAALERLRSGLVALDLLRWGMHWALHRVPVLWRLHRVHHGDLDYDCTIALGYVAHGNVSLPQRWDRLLRAALVTPDVHRVHHSVRSDESQSNYGSILTWWDQRFGTYRAQPAGGQLGMVIGLGELRDPRQLTLAPVLWLPISRSAP